VALNCVANGKLLRQSIFDDVWIQPASGDAGGALGAALACWHIGKGEKRIIEKTPDNMNGAYLGPDFSNNDVIRMARRFGAIYQEIDNFDELCRLIAAHIANEEVVGWFQGRMEYGPRALGNRSIIGDPRSPAMQKKINLKIKYREGFRPFAPSVLEEEIETYFQLDCPSPYMLLVAPVDEKRQIALPDGYNKMELYDRLYFLRSDIPAITHVDYSARIQSVNRHTNQRYWQLISAFKEITGYGLVVNTSFNVRGEPIVCNPQDAYLCFMNTEMDWLVIGNFVFDKRSQPPLPKNLQARFDAD
jgi:carbamoyltransferase